MADKVYVTYENSRNCNVTGIYANKNLAKKEAAKRGDSSVIDSFEIQDQKHYDFDYPIDLEFCKALLNKAELEIEDLPNDIIETVNFTLDNTLDEREKIMIKMKFKGMTYKEIGEAFLLSNSRVRQIIEKSYRKLRYISRAQYFKLGKKEFDKRKMEHEKEVKNVQIHNITNDKKETFKAVPIETLELSQRAYLSLKRAGINTLFDICDKNPDDLKRIRNLGKERIKEIKDAIVINYGFDILQSKESN